MILLDTNIVIYYLQGVPQIADWLEQKISQGTTLAISSLSVVELLGFKKITPIEVITINHILQTVLVVDVDIVVAQEAAKFRSVYDLKTVDSVIVASAKVLSAQLITNDKNLHKVSGIHILSL